MGPWVGGWGAKRDLQLEEHFLVRAGPELPLRGWSDSEAGWGGRLQGLVGFPDIPAVSLRA